MSAPLLSVAVRMPLGRFSLDARFSSAHHVTGLFGPSGAGKTSLLEGITGVRRSALGVVRLGELTWLDSERSVYVPPEGRDIGYVPQAGLLFPQLSARENVRLGERRAKRRGLPFERGFANAVDVLELGPLLDQPVSVLSGGERQRVALARALCSGPRLLVLDEPLASLDVALQRRLLPFLRRVREEFSVPMLLVSHSPLEIQALCDHVVAMREGRVVAEGPPSVVLSRPEVIAGASGEGLLSVFEARPSRATGTRSVVRLVDSTVELGVRGYVGDASATVLVGVPSDAVMLATVRPESISAANVLEGTIARIDASGEIAIVHVTIAAGHPSLLAELTMNSVERLGLVPGATVYAVVKASACELVGGLVPTNA